MNKKIIVIVSSILIVLLISIIIVSYLSKNNLGHNDKSDSSLKISNTASKNNVVEEEYLDVRKIIENEYLRTLKEKLSITINNTDKYIDRFILPKKINGTNIKTMDAKDFFEQYSYIYDGIIENIKKGEKININYPKTWKILNIENSEDKNLDYSKKEEKIEIISLGKGIYELEFQLENGDIIYLIFT